jgi:hypothetical protein
LHGRIGRRHPLPDGDDFLAGQNLQKV